MPKKQLAKATPVTIAPAPRRLPGVWQLAKQAAQLLWTNRQLLLMITLVYAALSIVLVHGLANTTNVSDLKREVGQVSAGNINALSSSFNVFIVLAGSSGGGSASTSAAYQFFLTVIASLALIWAMRQVIAGKTIRPRDAYYKGMYPLVPFILVLAVCGVQLLPLIIGSSLYSMVVSAGVAVYAVEKVFTLAIFLALSAVSLYYISPSIMALYISTLPGMTPLKALRTGRELVQGRRLAVLGRIVSLPIILMVIAAVIIVPVIIIAAPLAQWLFFALTILALPAVHAYLYGLYRELISE